MSNGLSSSGCDSSGLTVPPEGPTRAQILVEPSTGLEDPQEASERMAAQKEAAREFFSKTAPAGHQPVQSTLTRMAGRAITLDEAASVLVAELDPSEQDNVLRIAEENHWPVWVVMLGAVAQQSKLQLLLDGDFRSEWLNSTSPASQPTAATCVQCGQVIPGARRGQVACCSRHGSQKDDHNEGCVLGHIMMIGGRWIDSHRIPTSAGV